MLTALESVFSGNLGGEEMAKDIEQCMFDLAIGKKEGDEVDNEADFEEYSDSAKEIYKSKFLVLKKALSHNEELRNNLLGKVISSYDVVRMESKDMATKDQAEKLAALVEEAWKNAQVACVPMDETDQFQCRKCKKRRCVYFQKQTRSADEPMTTFISCRECGNQWKEC